MTPIELNKVNAARLIIGGANAAYDEPGGIDLVELHVMDHLVRRQTRAEFRPGAEAVHEAAEDAVVRAGGHAVGASTVTVSPRSSDS